MTRALGTLALSCFLAAGASAGEKLKLGEVGPRLGPTSEQAGTIYGRTGASREFALREFGGTKESEAAVVRGLHWLSRHQNADGKWQLDHADYKERGQANDVAATALALLPFLGAGKTHKASPDNPYDKRVEKGLAFLIRKQDKKTGNFGGGMYAHGMATIALCEAYGLSQDPALRRPAQLAVNYIVKAQHEAGGWRYSPGQAGDTSVTGWQVMALQTAKMAGLDVAQDSLKKAVRFLDSIGADDGGYGYTGPGSTASMTAVGLLCRQYLQAWGPWNVQATKGMNHLKRLPPGKAKHAYYYYYATQVMHHAGGMAWKEWNEAMRDHLVKTQDTDNGPHFGSWPAAGDAYGMAGGQLMVTSLSLCTLEIYYRYVPLHYRQRQEKP